MTEDIKQRLSLAIARARRWEPQKSLLELLESIMTDTSTKRKRHLTTDEELLQATEAWIIRKKAIKQRNSGKAEK